MKTNTQIYSLIRPLFAVAIVVSLTACGTSQYTPYEDNDGIYNSTSQSSEAEVSETESDNSSYYKQYFQAKASTYANAPEDDVIFTDVEGYTSTETYIADDGTIYEEEVPYSEAYGPWGDESSVTVNVYSNPGYGYWNRPLWWYGSGWGLNYWNYGWAGYYGPTWGWHSPYYWNIGYGYGYPYYGYGTYYNPYYGGYSNYVAYNRGRRNTDYRPGRSTGRSNATTRSNRSYSRSEIDRRINNARTRQDARRSATRSRTNIYSRSRTNTNRNSNMSRQNTRRSSPPRTISRPPTTTNRSSGTINRSGSSVRSSGTRTGGSSRSGGGRG